METPSTTAPLTPTPASEWKGAIQVEGTDLALPSGNVARVKQLSPEAFLSSGMIPDPLMAIITKAINTNKGMPPSAVKELSDDPKKLGETLMLFNRVMTYVTVAPVILMPPPCAVRLGDGGPVCGVYANTPRHRDATDPQYHQYTEGQRDPGVLYADQIDMNDKMFIFNWSLGGTRDLEQFREQLAGNVESVSNGQNVQGAPKRPRKRK